MEGKFVANLCETKWGEVGCTHTIDSDGNGLVEGEAVSTNESWDFAELVDLEVILRDSLSWLGLDDVELDVVGLCNCTNGS